MIPFSSVPRSSLTPAQSVNTRGLPIIAASLVVPAGSELLNVPQLRAVDAALRIVRHLGCTVEGEALCAAARGRHGEDIEVAVAVAGEGQRLAVRTPDGRTFIRSLRGQTACVATLRADRIDVAFVAEDGLLAVRTDLHIAQPERALRIGRCGRGRQ